MKWDQGLATTIQDFLNGCLMTEFPTHFGQNVYTDSARFSNISDAEALYAAKNWEKPLVYFGLSSIQFNEATRPCFNIHLLFQSHNCLEMPRSLLNHFDPKRRRTNEGDDTNNGSRLDANVNQEWGFETVEDDEIWEEDVVDSSIEEEQLEDESEWFSRDVDTENNLDGKEGFSGDSRGYE
ncbi:hypothetical protein L5515_012408 [Caenorhabditis briggsae]|uniref:Uncharacterized protein n=1 Tax=Caenorhabditis briggsae TaxID=6238 RepID=A0AAE9JH18_CAEBR|nr:hypothetical protein L5515_012408 [Caenorhabditis briggsae]